MVYRFPAQTGSSSLSSHHHGRTSTTRGGHKAEVYPTSTGRSHNESWSTRKPQRTALTALATAVGSGYSLHVEGSQKEVIGENYLCSVLIAWLADMAHHSCMVEE